jgi:hypothetical protein
MRFCLQDNRAGENFAPSIKRRQLWLKSIGSPFLIVDYIVYIYRVRKINPNPNCMKMKVLYSVLILSLVTLIGACDDEETPITGIQFEVDEQEVAESDGTLESFHPDVPVDGLDGNVGRIVPVTLSFDRALAGDVVIKIDISGTASPSSVGDDLSDYAILEESDNLTVDDDEITILSGTEEASFSIVIFEDLLFEYEEDGDFNADGVSYETVEIELEEIVSGPGKLGTELEHTLRILEDDVFAYLQWEPQDLADADNDVDMDFFISFENGFGISQRNGGTGPEIMIIPGGIGEGEVTMAYNYYSGSSNDLTYWAGFFSLAGTLDGEQYIDAPLEFEGTYTAENINPYDVTDISPKVAQTAVKDDINYDDFSGLNSFPDGGSRSKTVRPIQVSKAELLRSVNRRQLNIVSRANIIPPKKR